jgi:hypothetical protein
MGEDNMMHRIATLGVALVVLLATSAIASSSASAEKLTLSADGTVLEPGDAFWLKGYGNLSITTPPGVGYIECEPWMALLHVSVLTNSRSRDELQSQGIEEVSEGDEPCRSFTGPVTVAPYVEPGVLKLGASGKATIGPVGVFLFFERWEGGGKYEGLSDWICVYRRKRLPGTDNATMAAEPLEVGFDGSLGVKSVYEENGGLRTKARQLCPAKLKMALYWDEGQIESEQGVIEEQIAHPH